MKKLLAIAILFTGCIETDLQAPIEESLRIVLSGESFRVGGTYALQAEFVNSDGLIEDVSVSWESSDPNVFSIDGTMGSGEAEGTVILTASAQGLEATEEILIEPSKGSLQITMFTEQLQVGNDFTMGVNYIDADGNAATPDVVWTSSDISVATITSEGVLNAVAVGTSTITANVSGLTDNVTLTVVSAPVVVDPEVRITQFVEELDAGESFMFEATYFGTDGLPDETETITWNSSNIAILTVDANGLATGVSEGTATIQATANGISEQFQVTVLPMEVQRRTGSLMGTGYTISGDFALQYNADDELILTVQDYVSDGPGPYFYLTNSTGNISNGLNLGKASTNGAYEINVTQIATDEGVSVDLFTYGVLMVWCEPFGVRLGFGEFEN